jgi:2-desacetyl-2-hydroxyethyl bacteriochlorophyllide A dehydrogenase
MQQIRIHGVNDVRLDQVPRPEPGPQDVLIEVASCGICGSDIGYIAMGGLTPPGQPMPLGHELSGVIAATGAKVQHLQAGQRVVVNPTANGTDIGNGGPEGGFAPWLLVTGVATNPEAVLALPASLSFEQGALVEPFAVATHAVNQSGISPGQSALVLGAGPIGLCTVAVLNYAGIKNIVVTDPSAHRLAIARSLGAQATCLTGSEDLAQLLQQRHGSRQHYHQSVANTDVFIEATGIGAVLKQAIDLARPGATVVVVGVHKSAIELHPLDLLMKELHLVGSMAYPTEFPQVLEMLASGRVDTNSLISHRLPLQDFHTALAIARDPQVAAKVIVEIGSGDRPSR